MRNPLSIEGLTIDGEIYVGGTGRVRQPSEGVLAWRGLMPNLSEPYVQ